MGFVADETSAPVVKKKQGFASMSVEDRKRVAAMGGRAAHFQGKAHEWTSDEARRAGRKGGEASHGGGRKAKATV